MLRYRILISLLAVIVLFRHGRARLQAPQPPEGEMRPHIWLHGASNGELASVRPVLERLLTARPDLGWLVTANTESGRDMVAGWGLPGVEARLAPLDLARLSRRVMRDWRIVAQVTLEAELWPHRLLSKGDVPTIILGARMSVGTARGWARLGNLPGRMLAPVVLASAQDGGSAERLTALGLADAARGPVVDLKAFYAAPQVTAPKGIDRGNTWLAASTHEVEEEVVLAAHALARQKEPSLRLILAIRHTRRAADVRAMIESCGFTVGQRSLGDLPGQGDVYLADTMGEMPLWYVGCGRVFIGGTLTDRGGHTPFEPAAYGAALLYGPDTRNFRAAFGRLAAENAAIRVNDAASIAKALGSLSDQNRQSDAGARAKEALRPDTGPEGLCQLVLQQLPPA